ncbi:hypothetical protein BGZ57DRAFT_996646 [Hyaloscypha finlandica]|nr:hypothetical protein BGZ57DRAFT_996646 [Hyaloscypha finlandica]
MRKRSIAERDIAAHDPQTFTTAPIIFITGISGYIGGQVLHDITKKHPEYQVRGLVRTKEQQQQIASKYPLVKTVIGDLDSAEVLKAEAAQVDVVLQLADADHNSSVLSLLPSLQKTGTFIQRSGAASIFTASNGLGQLTTKKWSDIADLKEVTTFDHSHLHAVTDQLVLSEGKKQGIRAAVVVPPCVYGTGQGEVKKTSMVFPWYVDAVKKRGRGFTLWEGTNVDSVIHVRDLAAAFVLLVEEALKEGGGGADWGEEGWYYVEGGEYVFREMAGEIVKGMMKKGWIEREGVNEIKIEEAKELHSYAELLWGITMRVNGERIRDLGWSAKEESVFESIPELLAG